MSTLKRTTTGQSNVSQSTKEGKDPRNALKRTATTTTDPQSGSLNHLTAAQGEIFEEFKELLQKDGWWSPDGVNEKPTHDDGTLLRYLRARKFDVKGAYGQFTDTEKWLKEQRVEELYEHFDVELYERARKMYPQWTGRRDKRGIPIYVYEIKGLDTKNVTRYQKETQAYKESLPNHKNLETPAKLLPLFALYHNLLNMVLPLCSTLERPNPEVPVTNSTNIVDITGVGLTQFWNLKQHMQDASVLATAHYPETLDRIFIIGAPAFFPTVWSWIKRWFDPVTVSKIFILGKSEVKSTLSSFMDIENIPKKYGGTLDYKWGDMPNIGPDETKALEADGSKGWIPGPCLFLDHKRIPVGSEKGKLRRTDEEIAGYKPVIYAADYTPDPVHPEKAARESLDKQRGKHANGKATVGATTASTVATTTAAAATATTVEARPSTPRGSDNKLLNVHSSPSGDSHVHLPDDQPAPPAVTAEYISTENLSSPEPTTNGGSHTSAATSQTATPKVAAVAAVAAPQSTPVNTAVTSPTVAVLPPPGQTQPGPLSRHTVEVSKKIAQGMTGESISVLPAEGGSLGHPEITLVSDAGKGLAIETDKLALNGSADRPGVERFTTAAEIPTKT